MLELVRMTAGHPKEYFEQVAELNMTTIRHGVLPVFGKEFLTRLYYELALSPQSGLWGVVENGKVLGFVAGCADVRKSYISVLLRAGIPLASLVFRAVLTPGFVQAVSAIAAYPFRGRRPVVVSGSTDPRDPQLLAIAVADAAQGRGIGKMLVQALEQGFLSWGLTGCYRVATNVEEQGSNAFYQRLGFAPCGRVRHHRLILQMYEKEIAGSRP